MNDKILEIESELESILHQEIQRNNLDLPAVESLLNENIILQILTTNVKDLIVLSENNNKSMKPYNIIVNIKKSIDSVIELLLSFSLSDCLPNIILCLLNFIYRLIKLSTIQIDVAHANTILYLHNNNAFNCPIKEEIVYEYISTITDILPAQIINDLDKLLIINIRNGEIALKEKVIIRNR